MFKIEVEDGNGSWSDVRGDDGKVLTFAAEHADDLSSLLEGMKDYGKV